MWRLHGVVVLLRSECVRSGRVDVMSDVCVLLLCALVILNVFVLVYLWDVRQKSVIPVMASIAKEYPF